MCCNVNLDLSAAGIVTVNKMSRRKAIRGIRAGVAGFAAASNAFGGENLMSRSEGNTFGIGDVWTWFRWTPKQNLFRDG